MNVLKGFLLKKVIQMGACTSQKSHSYSEVRIKHSLNKNEEAFVAKRRKTVLKSLQKLKIQCSKDKVLNIAILGSGGGQRAMVGLLGSLVELHKAGLLDCILYLSGVSGSTWCMASLYQEPDWSTKLETVKNKIIKRLSGPGVSWGATLAKLKKYYYGKDFFSLTDLWAVLVVITCVKEMGACTSQESHSYSEVRIKHSLNKNEEAFVAKRRKTVLKSLQKLKIQCNKDKVPNIALLGSGGGQRAMVGLLGSLVELDKAGLLDCMLYLSGVSGSTWCMASLYKEPDWSTKLETVKDKIIKRLSGPGVSWGATLAKLKKYYYGKDFFSLTDLWAVLVVITCVKEIDEHTLTSQHHKHNKDPFPIYTGIDKQCKQRREGDPWFEISPHEAGYSLTGAFVGTSSFGSQFNNGCKIKNQPEMDMLYLQALCGSAFADEEEIKKFIWQKIKGFFHSLMSRIENGMIEGMEQEPNSPPVDKCCQVLMDLADMNRSVLSGADPFDFHKSIRKNLNELTGGKVQHVFQLEKLNLADKEAAILHLRKYTLDICACLSISFNFWPFNGCVSICRCAAQWIWGRKYDFLQNMNDKSVPRALLESETRDYIDAGLLLNSPYFSVLREERDIDLIISLDFSEGDPFMTVRGAAETCKKLNIPFPEVHIPSKDEKKPQDFYVFKGKNAPTVIHIPLFNVVNCGDKLETWRNEYATRKFGYSAEKITKLMEVAGRNISNNRAKLIKQIHAVISEKLKKDE